MTDEPQPSEAVGRERCTCMDVLGEDPRCALHGYATEWSLENRTPQEWQDDAVNLLAELDQQDRPLTRVEAVEAAFREGFTLGDFAGGGQADPQTVDLSWSNSRSRSIALATPAASSTGADPAWLDRDEAHLALWKAISAIKIENATDDKLIIENLRRAGIALARFTPETNDEG